MNKRVWVSVGVVAAVLAAAAVVAVNWTDRAPPSGRDSDDARLLTDIRKYREQGATLPPEAAAEQWFQLYDRAASLQEMDAEDGDMAILDYAIVDMVGARSLLAALPPPSAWPEFRRLATQRANDQTDDRAALGLKFLGEMLTGDRDSAAETLAALEQAGADPGLVIATHSLLARLYGDEESRLAAFQRELHAAGKQSRVDVPDLHAMFGEQRATALLTAAVASEAYLNLEGGAGTRTLARRIALANLGQMKRPQWDLAADIDGAPLYEALVTRFSQAPEQESSAANATIYYFLRMVGDGRQADAERALRALTGRAELSLPHVVVEALTAAQLNEPLYRYLHAQLERQPAMRAWDVYIEQAAFTGHSLEALRLVDAVLARTDLDSALRAELRKRRTAALLAGNQIDAAVAELLTRFAKAPVTKPDSRDVDAAISAAAVGRLTGRTDLARAGVEFARAALLLPPGDEPDFELAYTAPKLYAELRKQRREADAIQIIEARLAQRLLPAGDAGEESTPEEEYYESSLSFDKLPGLVELAAIHSAAGRHAQVLELLADSTDWGKRDLGELLDQKDSLGLPLGAIVARALRASADTTAALRVANATIAAHPGNDAAYDIIAAIDTSAAQTLDARFALDPYEERPLIWKAKFQLDQGAAAAAEATIRRAISIDPSDGEEGPNDRMRAYAVLAEILRGKGDTRQAALYEGAVRAIRMSEQADELHGAGLYQRAFAQYRSALEQFSDAYCIQSRLAVQLNKQGRRAEALAHYRRAYELMPSSFGRVESHCFGCENVFQGSDQQSIAEQVFSDIIRRSPRNAQAHYLLAYLREQQGEYPEALQSLRAAVSLDDHYLNAWKRLQDLADKTYIDAGERDIARLKLLELDPLQRHVRHELTEVGALAALWNGAARAHDVHRQAAPPVQGVYRLAATASAREALLKALPAESREQFEQMEDASETVAVFSVQSMPPPPVVLGRHKLVVQAQRLMGLKSRAAMFTDPYEEE